jgi:hypothetical protein
LSTRILIVDLVLLSFSFISLFSREQICGLQIALLCITPLQGCDMKLPLRRSELFALVFLFSLLLPCLAAADCLPPATVGIVICQPSPNATVFQTPHFEAAVNPTSGSITGISVLVDGKQIFDGQSTPLDLFEGVSNGKHALALDATDSFGRHYKATETFTVIGNTPPCPPPAAVGVRICSPAQGDVVSQNLSVATGFKGLAAIHHVRIYIGSTVYADFDPPFSSPGQLDGASAGPIAVGTHKITVVAWDVNGKVNSASDTFKTFFDGGCPPKGNICTPALTTDSPQDGDDVTSPFLVSAHVDFNTIAVSAIKIYLDGTQVGESFGPTFHQETKAAKGTHILTLQAWDVDGNLYRVTRNVNVR